MPLPLGHTAIGLAVYETSAQASSTNSRALNFLMITLLANLPDLDVLLGLILQSNGAAFHRGPTHSLVFAFAAGWLCSQLWRFKLGIPKWSPIICTTLILSHVFADMLLTTTPVSLFWPLELHWSSGHSGWGEVVDMVLFQSIQDVVIALVAFVYLTVLRFFRGDILEFRLLFLLNRKRAK